MPFDRKKRPSGLQPRSPTPPAPEHEHVPNAAADGMQRLQKVLAAAGLGSRRDCETLITSGRVEVDGQVVNVLGAKVDPDSQEIRVDGQRVHVGRRVHYLVNKPVGIVSTHEDPSGRPRVIDLVPPSNDHLFTVGRLDLSSEGLILVTNDGELANRLAHPRYGVEKTYHVLVAGVPAPELIERLRKGIHLAEGVVRADRVSIKQQHKQSAILEMVLTEGRNREIRRMLARLGHKVMQLRRVAIGPLKLADLKPGEFRRLDHDEVDMLRRATRGEAPRKRKSHGRRPKKHGNFSKSTGPRRVVIGGEAPSGKPPRGKRRARPLHHRRPRPPRSGAEE